MLKYKGVSYSPRRFRRWLDKEYRTFNKKIENLLEENKLQVEKDYVLKEDREYQ